MKKEKSDDRKYSKNLDCVFIKSVPSIVEVVEKQPNKPTQPNETQMSLIQCVANIWIFIYI